MSSASQTSVPDPGSIPRIDLHVHMVGNGKAGTGCWLRTPWWRRPVHKLLVRSMGLDTSALDDDLEALYTRRLRRLVRESSLDAVVLLAQEEVYEPDGRRRPNVGTFHVPNQLVLDLAARHPEFLPGVSIHPARKDAFEALDYCVQQGAVLMKYLPNCQNIDCSDKRYTRFWERMAGAGLPLLAHTGGEYTLQVVNPAYSDPKRLELPLQCGVKVIAAHCATRSGLTDPQYFHDFVRMLDRYPNLWGDNSAFLVYNDRSRGCVMPSCLREPIVSRILHGSDFPVPVSGLWAWTRGFLKREDFNRWRKHPNVIERDYQWKRLIGFPEATFTRASSVLRIPPTWTKPRKSEGEADPNRLEALPE